jgi:hypothetical protein
MKSWMIVLSMVAILGMSGVADACHNGKQSQARNGIHGRISSVGQSSFSMTTNGREKGSGRSVIVSYGPGTTFNGAASIDSSLVGHEVAVVGLMSGDTITASSITMIASHHHKHAA